MYENLLWPETALGGTAVVECPCSQILQALAGNALRICNGTHSQGAAWEDRVDTTQCAVHISSITRKLCDTVDVSHCGDS